MENWTSSTMTTRERKETEWENARCIVTNDVEFVVKSQWMRYIRSKKHENWLKTIVIPFFWIQWTICANRELSKMMEYPVIFNVRFVLCNMLHYLFMIVDMHEYDIGIPM